jgi:hypothetical protein
LSYVPEFLADSPSRLLNPTLNQLPEPTQSKANSTNIHQPVTTSQLRQFPKTPDKSGTQESKPEPVGVRGLEPRTSALSELRSNHLSYTPRKLFPNSGADILPAFAAVVQSPVA